MYGEKDIAQGFLETWVKQHWDDEDYFEKTEVLVKEFSGYWHSDNVMDFHHEVVQPYSEDLMKYIESQGMLVFRVELDLFGGQEEVNWFIFPSSVEIKKLTDKLQKMNPIPKIHGIKTPDIQSLGQNENYKPVFCETCFALTDNGTKCRDCEREDSNEQHN